MDRRGIGSIVICNGERYRGRGPWEGVLPCYTVTWVTKLQSYNVT
jgi:hypothetical protein